VSYLAFVFAYIFSQVDNEEEVDFMYADTGLYSCIGVEMGGQPLGTTISNLKARGRSFNSTTIRSQIARVLESLSFDGDLDFLSHVSFGCSRSKWA